MKKMKVMALVMVMALVAIGGAYALWFDTLTITETVTTGTVEVNWVGVCGSDWGCNYEEHGGDVYGGDDQSPNKGLDSMDPGNPNDSKNIGCKERWIRDENGNEVSVGKTLHMSLINGYPGYQEDVQATIRNDGTIPVKFMLKLTDDPGNIIYNTDNNPDGWLIVEFSTLQQSGDDFEGFQLDPDKELSIKITQRVRQIAPQGVGRVEDGWNLDLAATFAYTIQAVQWNEYDFYPLPDEITFPRIQGPDDSPVSNPIPWDTAFTTSP